MALLLMGLLSGGGLRAQAKAGSSKAAPATNSIGYTSKKLSNGLDVIVVENHMVPLATIELVARNGGFTEPPEFSGLSHLYEHMFFKANAKYPSHLLLPIIPQ